MSRSLEKEEVDFSRSLSTHRLRNIPPLQFLGWQKVARLHIDARSERCPVVNTSIDTFDSVTGRQVSMSFTFMFSPDFLEVTNDCR